MYNEKKIRDPSSSPTRGGPSMLNFKGEGKFSPAGSESLHLFYCLMIYNGRMDTDAEIRMLEKDELTENCSSDPFFDVKRQIQGL